MALATYLVVLLLMLVVNCHIICVQQKSPNHAFWTGVRFGFFAVAAYFTYSSWGDRLVLFIGFNAAFWLPFDIVLNLIRHHSWLYVGETAWLDKLGRQWPAAFFYTRVLFLIAGIAILSYDLTELSIYSH